MGNIQTIDQFFTGDKTKAYDDDHDRPLLHHPRRMLPKRQNNHRDKSITSFCRDAVKSLWRKLVQFIFCFPWPGKTEDHPILPVQNPAQGVSNGPAFIEDLLLSSPGKSTDPCENAVFMLSPEEVYSAGSGGEMPDRVIVSVPEFEYLLSLTTASEEQTVESSVFLQEIGPSENVPFPEAKKLFNGKKEEKEEVVIIKRTTAVEEGPWIKHYCSRHRILLVGEGDFSFSASLAVVFGCAANMIATSLDSKEFLKKNYENAASNIKNLRKRKCKVLHGINATKMASHKLLGHLTFDRIIFNFPFAGFFKDLSREKQLKRHRRLVSLFLKNAREMISEDGEIHISHKTNEFHVEWKLECVASSHRLRLIEAVKFDLKDYPGYRTKCGFGGDNNFNCNPSKTYKFGLKMVRY